MAVAAPEARHWGPSEEPAAAEEAGLPDVTLLLDDVAPCHSGEAAGSDPASAKEEPVLSLVSLNPKTAATQDLKRGRLQVLPDLPVSAAASTTLIECGRDTAHTMVLSDSRVSLLHFTIRMRTLQDGCVALDLIDQSSNGTWVNGQRVGQGKCVPLKVGDKILVLPAAHVGREAEVGYLLLHDARGAACGRESPILARPSREAAAKPVAPADPVPQGLERDIRCGICADALFRCLTLVPCGHNFCTGCLVKWRRQSPVCPECRTLMEQVMRNASVDRVVEAYLRVNPEAARTQAEVAHLDLAERDPQNAAVLRWLLRDKGPGELRGVPTPNRSRWQEEHRGHLRAMRHGVEYHPPQRRRRSSACVVS